MQVGCRSLFAGISIFLAACSQGVSEAPSASNEGEQIACALGGAEQFLPDCTVERSREDGSLFLTVRHPDGGFRRFEVLTDGHGLAAADGMQQVDTQLAGDLLEVGIASDRYRFPATVKDSADNL